MITKIRKLQGRKMQVIAILNGQELIFLFSNLRQVADFILRHNLNVAAHIKAACK